MGKAKAIATIDQARQGDVFFLRVDNVPDGAVEEKRDDQGRIVLAYGEVTGHAHAIHDQTAVLLSFGGAERFLKIARPTTVYHEEHHNPGVGSILELPPGNYKVRIQKEHVPGELPRQVVD